MAHRCDHRHVLQKAATGTETVPGRLLRRGLGPQEQGGICDQPLATSRCRVAPGRIELADLPARQSIRSDGARQEFALLFVGARQRHQVLRGGVGNDLALANQLLHRIGELSDQGETTAYPALVPVEAIRELLEREAKSGPDLREQPRLLESRFPTRAAERSSQQQRLDLGKVPQQRLGQILMKTPQRSDASIAVDHHQLLGGFVRRHNHDRHQLPDLRKRRDQPLVALRRADAKRLVAQIELTVPGVNYLSSTTTTTLPHPQCG